jgi:5-formyltetrahydrofolate cyclo-ligase
MMYLAMAEEVDTETLATAALTEGKRLCLPRLERDSELSAVHVENLEGLTLTQTRLKIRQPSPGLGEGIDPAEIALNLIPCVGVDRGGRRLGLGGGHYDRFLLRTRADAVNLGLVFDCQVVDSLPHESHDRRLSGFVTESGVCWTA